MEVEIETYLFKSPACINIAGPSQSGKSTAIHKILTNLWVFEQKPVGFVFCKGIETDQKWSDDVIEFKGIPTEQEISKFSERFNKEHWVLIFDDLITEMCGDKNTIHIFTRTIHHMNMTLIYSSQNVFSKNSRTHSLNTHYFLLTRNYRDLNQVKYLLSQIFPGKGKAGLLCYKDAISHEKCRPPMLYIDCYSFSTSKFRLQSCVFEEVRVIYEV